MKLSFKNLIQFISVFYKRTQTNLVVVKGEGRQKRMQ